MLIVSQDKKNIVNIDNVFAISAYDEEIIAKAIDGRYVEIGTFYDERKQKSVFNEIVASYRAMQNIYEVPEE